MEQVQKVAPILSRKIQPFDFFQCICRSRGKEGKREWEGGRKNKNGGKIKGLKEGREGKSKNRKRQITDRGQNKSCNRWQTEQRQIGFRNRSERSPAIFFLAGLSRVMWKPCMVIHCEPELEILSSKHSLAPRLRGGSAAKADHVVHILQVQKLSGSLCRRMRLLAASHLSCCASLYMETNTEISSR